MTLPADTVLWKKLDRGALWRALFALCALPLALAAALFSTVFRQEGNVLGVAIAASLALLLSGVVALVTVPYLARRVALESVRNAFDYDVTKEGVGYLAVTLVIGIAALNTGNNLLFIIVAAMLAAVLVSGIASAGVLNGLKLEVSVPEHVFAGRRTLARITLRNTRRLAPAYSVSVVPPKNKTAKHEWRWERSYFAFPANRPRERQWVHWPDRQLKRVPLSPKRAELFTGAVYFPYIPAGQTRHSDLELTFPRRGAYAQDEFGLSTRFPFSFLAKTRRIGLTREVIVYPRVEPADEFFAVLPLIRGEFESLSPGRGSDLYRVREYRPQDPARHVHWKATAKSGELKVREFTREDERRLRIVFDNPAPDACSPERYESAVALTASLAWHFAAEHTGLTYIAAGYEGKHQLYSFLRYLASVQPADHPPMLDSLDLSGEYNIVITAREPGSLPTALWASSYVIFIGRD